MLFVIDVQLKSNSHELLVTEAVPLHFCLRWTSRMENFLGVVPEAEVAVMLDVPVAIVTARRECMTTDHFPCRFI